MRVSDGFYTASFRTAAYLVENLFFFQTFLKSANGLVSYYRRDREAEKSIILNPSRQKLEQSRGDELPQPGSARVPQGTGLPGGRDHGDLPGGWQGRDLASQGGSRGGQEQQGAAPRR